MDFCYWTLAMHHLEMHACIFKRFLFCGVGLFVFEELVQMLFFSFKSLFRGTCRNQLQAYEANCFCIDVWSSAKEFLSMDLVCCLYNDILPFQLH